MAVQNLYQPSVNNGNVAPYVPSGQAYTPGANSYYQPNLSTPSTIVASGIPSVTQGSVNFTGGDKGFPSFNFDLATQQAEAYARLKPFYDKILSFTGGRLDLAKRIIEYTYEQGMRESTDEYNQAKAEQGLIFPQEKSEQQTTQNRRGVLESGFGATDRSRLQESQELRQQAVERALRDRESRLTSQRGFGLEEKQRGFEEEKFGQERERRQEASGMAMDKFAMQSAQYGMEVAKKTREEQREIQAKQNAYMSGSSGGGGGTPAGYRDYATYLAETGQQSTLDAMRRAGQKI